MNIERPEKVSNRCLEVVQMAAEALSNERQKFERFVNDFLTELDTARERLLENESCLARERDQLDQERAEFDQHESQAQAELEATQIKLSESASEANGLRNQLNEVNEALRTSENRAGQFEDERDAIRLPLERTNDELSKTSTILEMLESTQRELEETQSQLADFRGKAAAFNGRIERENHNLKHEIELAAKEASRLKDLVEDQKAQLNDNREKWTEELRKLRNVFDSRHRPETSLPPGPATVRAATLDEDTIARPANNHNNMSGNGASQFVVENVVDDEKYVFDHHGVPFDEPDDSTQAKQDALGEDLLREQEQPRNDFSELSKQSTDDYTWPESSVDEDDFEFDFGVSSQANTSFQAEPNTLTEPSTESDGQPQPERHLESEPKEDAVLGSILAQFQELEADVAKVDN